jgi:hypothetical protein
MRMWGKSSNTPPLTCGLGNYVPSSPNLIYIIVADIFEGLTQSKAAEEFQVDTRTITLKELSNPIQGKHGSFRVLTTADGQRFNVDSTKVSNSELFSPSCEALVSVTTRASDKKKWISNVTIIIKDGRGAFILR